MSHPIGTKKAKIMKYLQDSGVVIDGEKLTIHSVCNPHPTYNQCWHNIMIKENDP
jgi:hypothetical protein